MDAVVRAHDSQTRLKVDVLWNEWSDNSSPVTN